MVKLEFNNKLYHNINKTYKIIVIIFSILFLIVSVSEIISYLYNHSDYMLGSVAMIDNGGWQYKNQFTFIFYHLANCVLCILILILLILKKGKYTLQAYTIFILETLFFIIKF
mgnify:CR=1 FL=1